MKAVVCYHDTDYGFAMEIREILAGILSDAADDISMVGLGSSIPATDIVALIITENTVEGLTDDSDTLDSMISGHRDGDFRLIPLVYEPCRWKVLFPDSMKTLPEGGLAVKSWSSREDAVESIAEGLARNAKVFKGMESAIKELDSVGVAGLGNTPEEEELLSEAEGIISLVESGGGDSFSEEAAEMISRAGSLLYGRGLFQDALRMHKCALEIRRGVHGENVVETAESCNEAGCALDAMGLPDEALVYYEQALDIFGKVLPRNHPDVAACLSNAGGVLRLIGEYDEALEYLEEAMLIDMEAFDPRHPQVAADLSAIGMVKFDMELYDEALNLFEQALEIDVEVRGHDDPVVAERLNNFAMALKEKGEQSRALECLEKAIGIDIRIFGPKSKIVARDHNNIGSVLKGLGDYSAAEIHFRKSIDIFQGSVRHNDPDFVDGLHNLANLMVEMEKFDIASGLLRRIVEIMEGNPEYSEDDFSTACHNLGIALFMTGRNVEASTYMERALNIRRRVLGEGHPDTLAVMESLAILEQGSPPQDGEED